MKSFFKITNLDTTPQIFINGVIGEDANFASLRAALCSLIDQGCKRIKLIINSAGGSMTEGFAMYDLLKSSGMVIEVEVIGLAASMGGILSQAASPGLLGIHSNASIMTHKAQTGASGESDDLRTQAEFADKLELKAKAIVAARSKATEAMMAEWFKAGTMKWFNAEEAVAAGLADFIIKSDEKPKAAKAFKNETEAFAMFYNTLTPELFTQTEDHNMKKVLISMLAAANVTHALTENSSDADFTALFQNQLAELAKKEKKISDLQNLVDEANKAKAEVLVENAITEGKIKADAKPTYVEMATANYDNVKALFDGLTGRVDVKNIIQLPGTGTPKAGGEGEEKAKNKTYNQHTEAELRELKSKDFTAFNALFKAEYGEDYSA